MSVYHHCEYRNCYDCIDGYCNCENCNNFKLDFETLTNKQKKTIKKILSHEDKNNNEGW